MELKLYDRLKRELLGSLAAASECHDPAYQKAVEAYGAESETGLKRWAREAISGWLERYNLLVSRPVRLRYYQILACCSSCETRPPARAATCSPTGWRPAAARRC